MAIEYIEVDEAIRRPGLRMVVVGNLPSPWSEAAKGILHVKGIPWSAVRLTYDSEPLHAWAGQRSGPVAIYENERPRAHWSEILLLAERLAPTKSLLPPDPALRALAFGLAHEICGEEGLGWSRRLQLVSAGLQNAGGFAAPVAKYLAKKYGYQPESAPLYGPRVVELLGMLSARLESQRQAGSHYYVGTSLTAVDIYSATFVALFHPLPHALCAMDAGTRQTFEMLDAPTAAALNPILLEHRDLLYAEHLELPISL